MTIKIKVILLIVVIALLAYHYQGSTHPNPNPDVPPAPGTGKFLIEYETAPEPDYTTDQKAALQNARTGDIEAWTKLNTAETHVLDQHADVSALDKSWQDQVEVAKKKPLPNISKWNGRLRGWSMKHIDDAADIKTYIGMKP